MEIWSQRREIRARHDDGRTDYEVDYARVVHSSSFRRLSGKTQIHHGDSDFVRTRLTHSLEVAQLALGIAQRVLNSYKNTDPKVTELVSSDALVQTLGLIHDLGHPPGGHAGEEALNAMMNQHGGFEGNGQTIRILSRLEANTEHHGANLTRRTMLGTLKYPVAYKDALNSNPIPVCIKSGIPLIGKMHQPPKCYLDTEEDVVEWLLDPIKDSDVIRQKRMKSFDCKLLDMADDLAYSVADCDDAISLGMLDREKLFKAMPDMLTWMSEKLGQTSEEILDGLYSSSARRKRQTGMIINALLGCVRIEAKPDIADPLYHYQPYWAAPADDFISHLKGVVYDEVIKSPEVQHDRMKIQRKIIELFTALDFRPTAYLPTDQRDLYAAAATDSERARVICDYIAGMTDRFLVKMHEKMMG